MPRESLDLQDNMSPSLKRIANETIRLHKQFQNLKSSVDLLKQVDGPRQLAIKLKQVGDSAAEAANKVKALQRAVQSGTMLPGGRVVRGAGGRFQSTAGVMIGGALNEYGRREFEIMKRQRMYEREAQFATWRSLGVRERYAMRYPGANYEMAVARRDMRRASGRFGSAWDSSFGAGGGRLIQNMASFSVAIAGATYALRNMASIFSGLLQKKDEMIGLKTRLATVREPGSDVQALTNTIYESAQRSRGDLVSLSKFATRVRLAGTPMDKSIQVAETTIKALVASGTSAMENRSTLLQLAQGIQSNRLSGDELRSIRENAPLVQYALADYLKIPVGGLKKAGEEGKLTAKVVTDALLAFGPKIDQVFQKMPWTLQQFAQIIENKFIKMIDQGLVSWYQMQRAVKDFANWLDTVEGAQFMKDLLDLVNMVIISSIRLLKMMAPVLKFIVQHLREIAGIMAIAFGVSMISNAMKFVQVLKGVEASMVSISLATKGWIGLLLVALYAIYRISSHMSDVKQKKDQWYTQQGELIDQNMQSAGYKFDKSASLYNDLYRSPSGELVNRQAVHNELMKNEAYRKKAVEAYSKIYESPEDKAKRMMKEESEMFNKIPAFNVQDGINIKGGMLDGIRDGITLSDSSKKLLRAIAVSEWRMQNETLKVSPKVQINNYGEPSGELVSYMDELDRLASGSISVNSEVFQT